MEFIGGIKTKIIDLRNFCFLQADMGTKTIASTSRNHKDTGPIPSS
jgi:hypothetical protein